MIIKRSLLFVFLLISFPLVTNAEIDNTTFDYYHNYQQNQQLLSRFNSFFAGMKGQKLVERGVVNVTVAELKSISPEKLYFKGEVETMADYTISSTKEGLLKYIISKGDYVFAQIKDGDGNIIREGVPIAYLDEAKLKEASVTAENRKKLASMGYEYLEKMTQAQENLADKNIITPFEIEAARIQLFGSLLEYEMSLKKIDEIILNSNSPNIFSLMSGKVIETYASPGDLVTENTRLIKIEQMDPILVKVECPVELLGLVHRKESALVYPIGVNKPIVSMINLREDDYSNLYINIPNKIVVSEKLTTKQKKLPKVFSVYPVKNYINPNIEAFYAALGGNKEENKPILVIPYKAIRYDEKGPYVFKVLSGDLVGNANGEVPRFFNVKKIPVILKDISATFCYGLDDIQKVRWIEAGKGLKAGDVVVGATFAKLSDGDKAVRVGHYWEFYPGQTVKVRIPGLTKPGIYVPRSAIIHQDSGEDYVYMVKNNVAKLVKVNISGFFKKYCLITGKDIRPGEVVIVMDNDDLYTLLYDGRMVKVIDTIGAPLFMENEHADDFRRKISSGINRSTTISTKRKNIFDVDNIIERRKQTGLFNNFDR